MEKHPQPSVLTGKEGAEFDFDLAKKWTSNYRDKHPGEIVSQFFGREILQRLLDQPGCMGIRMYYAHDETLNKRQKLTVSMSRFLLKVIGNIDGNKHLVLVGASADGEDMLPGMAQPKAAVPLMRAEMAAVKPADATPSADPLVVQVAMPCPGSANCPKNNM